jgi:hypothetical protein
MNKLTKTTYEAAITFLNVSDLWLKQAEVNAKTKLGYAIQRVRPRAEKLYNEYRSQVEDIGIDHCVTDDKNVILKDERGDLRFTKEGAKARNKALRELPENEVEIDPYFATSLDGIGLTVAQELAFEGFVLKEVKTEDEATKSLEASA